MPAESPIETLLLHLPVALLLVNNADQIRAMSAPCARQLLGRDAAPDWVGRLWVDLFERCSDVAASAGTAERTDAQGVRSTLTWSRSLVGVDSGHLIVFVPEQTWSRRVADEHYKLLFNSMGDAVFVAPLSTDGVHGRFVEVNDAACQRLGYTRPELLTRDALSLNPPANRERTRVLGRSIRREGSTVFEAIHVAKSGALIPVEVSARILSMGGRDYVLSVARDLREMKRLQQAEERLGRLVDHSWDEIYVFDAKTLKFLHANGGALDNLGYSSEELRDLRVTNIKLSMSELEFRRLSAPLFDGSQSRIIFETEHRRKDGTSYPVEVRLQLSTGEVPPVFLANVQDITERKRAEERLTYLANYDTLTGLPHRNLFVDRVQQALADTLRNERLLAIMFIDVDGLKGVNDAFGHHAGDQLLQEIAGRLRRAVRGVDTVARLSGDEFAVCIGRVTHVDAAERLADKIRQSLAEPVALQGQVVRVSASIGVTLFPFGDEDVTGLLRQADQAMYQAKQSGKNAVRFFEVVVEAAESRRRRLQRAWPHAVQRGELELVFQPRRNLQSAAVVGAEALLRWRHPSLGMVPPAEFIPMLEASSAIREVGAWVLRTAVEQMEPYMRMPGFVLSVNVSARQLEDRAFGTLTQQVLGAAGVSPMALEMEITEGALIERPQEVARLLWSLRERGVSIALDDFGTGYSSLRYLAHLPITCLKIDRSFVSDMMAHEGSAAIVAAIVGLGHSLRMRLVAEGVETEAQRDLLRDQRCHEGQGHFLGEPCPAAEFGRYLQTPGVL